MIKKSETMLFICLSLASVLGGFGSSQAVNSASFAIFIVGAAGTTILGMGMYFLIRQNEEKIE